MSLNRTTPRKRPAAPLSPPSSSHKANASPFVASSSGTKRGRDGLPTPGSSTRKTPRHALMAHDLAAPPKQPIFTPSLPSPPRTPHRPRKALPPALHTLLLLHRALDLALSLHMATHPPILPPIAKGTTEVRLENVTNYLAIRETVERTAQRRFGEVELGRLVWLWAWSGREADVPVDLRERVARGKGKEPLRRDEGNPFLEDDPGADEDEAVHLPSSPLSFILTPARTLDKDSRRVHTYGIGFTLPLTRAEVLSANNTLLGSHGVGSGAGIGAVGRWTAGGKERERAVEAKLRRWAGMFEEDLEGQDDLPTPTKTPGKDDGIPLVPCADLPALPASTGSLLPAFAMGGDAPTVTPNKPFPNRLEPPAEVDVFGPVIALPPPKGAVGKAKPGTVEERRQALYDRIKARKANVNGLSASSKMALGNISAAQTQNELKRRSTLSRLEGVAEAVWMLFSSSPAGTSGSSPGTSPSRRRRAHPMSEVSEIVVKSSKTPISHAEAKDSLILLTQLTPNFLVQRTIHRQEWLEMPSLASQAADRMASVGLSPGRPTAGPASPGRVGRTGAGGLREVRERIRRELGDM